MGEVQIRSKYKKGGAVSYGFAFEIANVGGKRKWFTKYGFKSKKEAKQAGEVAQQNYENFGQVVSKDEISYSDFIDYWLENDCAIDLKPVTVSKYEKMSNLLLKPNLGKYKLKSITKEILQTFLTEMYDKGYSYNSLTVIKGLLTKSFNFAVDNHYVNYSPALRLKIPKNRIPKVPTRSAPHTYIPKEYMEKIFERFPENSSSYLPLKLAYECGLRLGEVFALCWEDVDFVNKVIRINRQVQWYEDKERKLEEIIKKNGTAECGNGFWYFAPPKYKSYRVVEISDELADILANARDRQLKARDYYGIFYKNYYAANPLYFEGTRPERECSVNKISDDDSGYHINLICIRENGTYVSPRTMQHVSRVIKKEIFPDFDFHSLRHTHASMLLEAGAEQKYIQTRLGHSNLKITIDVYEHTTENLRSRGRAVVNKLYN